MNILYISNLYSLSLLSYQKLSSKYSGELSLYTPLSSQSFIDIRDTSIQTHYCVMDKLCVLSGVVKRIFDESWEQ